MVLPPPSGIQLKAKGKSEALGEVDLLLLSLRSSPMVYLCCPAHKKEGVFPAGSFEDSSSCGPRCPTYCFAHNKCLIMAKISGQEECLYPTRSPFSPLTLFTCGWYLGSSPTFCNIDPKFSPSESIPTTKLIRVQRPKQGLSRSTTTFAYRLSSLYPQL